VASHPNALWGASLVFSAINIVVYYAELPDVLIFVSLGIAVLVCKVIDGQYKKPDKKTRGQYDISVGACSVVRPDGVFVDRANDFVGGANDFVGGANDFVGRVILCA
jgi:hypothetical protein